MFQFALAHFLDSEVRNTYGINRIRSSDRFRYQAEYLRASVLVARSGIAIPIASIVEEKDSLWAIHELDKLRQAGFLYLYSPTSDYRDYASKKSYEYRDMSGRMSQYSDLSSEQLRAIFSLKWLPRISRSASQDVGMGWAESLLDGGLWDKLAQLRTTREGLIEDRDLARLENMAELLDGRAFLVGNVEQVIDMSLHPRERTAMSLLLSGWFLYSYVAEYNMCIVIDSPLGKLDCNICSSPIMRNRCLSYMTYKKYLSMLGLGSLLQGVLDWSELLTLKEHPPFREINDFVVTRSVVNASIVDNIAFDIDIEHLIASLSAPTSLESFKEYLWRLRDHLLQRPSAGRLQRIFSRGGSVSALERPSIEAATRPVEPVNHLMLSNPTDPSDTMSSRQTSNSVFLIHGRDTASAVRMRAFLRSLGLSVIEWNHALEATESASPFVLDVVTKGIELSTAVVVMFTPDEFVRLDNSLPGSTSPDEGYQARPNVWLEAGFALAMVRNSVVLVEVGQSRPASDLAGIHFVRILENTADEINRLVNKLRIAGCIVDTRGDDYIMATIAPL